MEKRRISIFQSIRPKVVAAIIVPPVLFLILGAVLFAHSVRQVLTKTSQTDLKQLETVNQGLLRQRLEDFSEKSQRLAINSQLIVPLKLNVAYQLQAVLDTMLAQNELQTLAVFKPDGVVCSTAGLAVDNYEFDRDVEIRSVRESVSQVRYGLDNDGRVVEMGFVLIQQADSGIGVLFAARVLSLNEVFARSLVVSSGKVVAESPSGSFLRPYVNTILEKFSGQEQISLGEHKISAIRIPIPGLEMNHACLLAGIDQTAQYDRQNKVMLYIGLVGLGTVLLIVIYSWVLSRRLTNPILRITNIAAQISGGQKGVEWLEEREDEVGILNYTLKAMTGSLQDSNENLVEALRKAEQNRQEAEHFSEKLQSLNESLEEVVRERTQDLIDAKEMAENASKMKGEFLANMSHEIRTPMNAIIGFSNVLLNEQISESQLEYVNYINDAGKNLLTVINDILDISKIESGKLQVEIRECLLRGMLDSVKSLMIQVADEKKLDFQIILASNLPATITTDDTRVRQCLINLANNAVKFTEKGHVYIKVSLDESGPEPFICFAVEDTGIGIASEKQALVFESFSQADGSTNRKFGGTGLGLTITKRLIEMLGGSISLESEVGKGSCFIVKIPVAAELSSETESQQGSRLVESDYVEQKRREVGEQGARPGHVLVAEDNVANQALIKLLLKKNNLQVTVANDGREAIDLACEADYDLILMDLQMPEMNGYDATRMLRSRGLATPIVALTAFAMADDREKALEAGCDDYLAKPINSEKLDEVVAKYIGGVLA